MTEYRWLCPVCPAQSCPPKINSEAKTKAKARRLGIRHIRRVHNYDGVPILEVVNWNELKNNDFKFWWTVTEDDNPFGLTKRQIIKVNGFMRNYYRMEDD